ncbi:uncharacterized protein LAESUDRAFT_764854 [Laetiporus sulphureus 93-53]|uniref:Uncharacterized protein n=1 Tax=Laetiporus sulphureus 93-53 TaxID=1314785 RepID=A0A165B3P6_9APHY|nr:uncharacterized protein LAESUDRAFT_764854 [Laetiporus sulphureus 93-53]KZT00164.1 hypothetical protein LAESUDRAFT_764854 [Laetiporus sulphureus 93-53]
MSNIQDSSPVDDLASLFSRLNLGATPSQDPVEQLLARIQARWNTDLLDYTELDREPGSGKKFLDAVFRRVEKLDLPRDRIPLKLRTALFKDGGEDEPWQRLQPLPDDQLDSLMAGKDIAKFLQFACALERPPAAIETIAEQQKRLDRAFHETFRGRFDELFEKSLGVYAGIYDKSIYYGRMIPFVQASGTGKTRLAWQLGLRMPAFCVCFREGELPTSGWPPRDVSREFFDGLDGPFTFLAEEKAAAFLGALVEVLHHTAPAVHHTAPADLEAWVKAWSIEDPTDLERSSRHGHFEEVKKLTRERLTKYKEELFALRLKHHITAAAEADNNTRGGKSGTSVTGWHVALFTRLAKPAFDLLAESVHRLKQKRFLLSLDECTELNDPGLLVGPKGPQREMSLIALQRIIKAADECTFPHDIEFWYMLLDTNSSVYELASSGPDASSFRLASALKPLPVWCYVDFDQMRQDNKQDDKQDDKQGAKQDDKQDDKQGAKQDDKQGSKQDDKQGAKQDDEFTNAEDALLISFLAALGRPYWYTLRYSPDLVRAAIKKLIYNDKFDPTNREHVFAVFANRIVLELNHTMESSRIAINAVRSHMRLLIGVHDTFITTAAPSEPMLAVAAAEVLNLNPQTYARALDTLMRRLIMDGVVTDRGRQGELCTRLLLTLARDKATLPKGGKFVDSTRRAVRPLRLSDFLKTLLGDDLGVKHQETTVEATVGEPTTQKPKAKKTKAAKPKAAKSKVDKAEADKAEAEQPKAEKANPKDFVKDADKLWINFTHWVQTSEELSVITRKWLAELWKRGAGVQCTHIQALFDSLFVTYSGDLNEPFDESLLGYVIVQIKAKTKASAYSLVAGLAGPIIERTDKSGAVVRYKPENYVALFMDFATESAFGHAGGPRVALEIGQPAKQTHGGWIGYLEKDKEPKRYCLNIRGHDSSVYTVITPEFKAQFDLLFAHSIDTRGPFEEAKDAMDSAINPISSILRNDPASLKAEKKAAKAAEKAKEKEEEVEEEEVEEEEAGGSSSK